MNARVSQGFSLFLMSALLLSAGGFAAAAEASTDASADFSVREAAKIRAVAAKERAGALQEKAQELRENALARATLTKEQAQALREQFKARADALQEKVAEREATIRARAKAHLGAQLERIKAQREQALEKAKQKVASLQERLGHFRAKANLTAEEKAEFEAKLKEHIQASFDQRIDLAQKLEAEGANATVVAEFVAFATAQKEAFANATTNAERKELVVEFNRKWRVFKQAVAEGVVSERLDIAIDSAASTLARLDAVIVKLGEANFSTGVLVNASAGVNASLSAASDSETLEEALFHLKQAHRGLVHLKVGIQRAVNHELVEAFRMAEKPADFKQGLRVRLGLSGKGSVNAGINAAVGPLGIRIGGNPDSNGSVAAEASAQAATSAETGGESEDTASGGESVEANASADAKTNASADTNVSTEADAGANGSLDVSVSTQTGLNVSA